MKDFLCVCVNQTCCIDAWSNKNTAVIDELRYTSSQRDSVDGGMWL